MAQVIINIPDEKLNQLNNFYLSEYGYDIHTQLINYVETEVMKASDYPSTEVPPHPHPTILNSSRGYYILEITYPDGKRAMVSDPDYQLLLDFWNEWSVTGFDIDERENVMAKLIPEKVKNIGYKSNRKKYIVFKLKDKVRYHFGQYATFDDAFIVKKFLEKHSWDMKYHSSQVVNDKITPMKYSSWLLETAKNEMGEL